MIRIPLRDPHAQAAARIRGRGWVLLPAVVPVGCAVVGAPQARDGEMLSTDRLSGITGPTIWSPFPDAGEAFYVGEVYCLDTRSPHDTPLRYWRAAGDVKPTDLRWSSARSMPEYAARTRFRVLSRTALRLGEVAEDMAAAMGLPVLPPGDRGSCAFYKYPPERRNITLRNDIRTCVRSDVQIEYLDANPSTTMSKWWRLWTGAVYHPAAWAFAAEVERV